MSDLIPKHGGYRKLKSFQVARASRVELRLDYEDFLRQRGLVQWERVNPLQQALIDRRCQTADEVAVWVVASAKRGGHCGQNGQWTSWTKRSNPAIVHRVHSVHPVHQNLKTGCSPKPATSSCPS